VNAAGLNFVLFGVLAALKMPDYQEIVTNGSVSADEFNGTIGNLTAVAATLKKTPAEKIEAMIDKNDAQLSAHLDKFNSDLLAGDPLPVFREAQTMAGYITTILAKSGLHE